MEPRRYYGHFLGAPGKNDHTFSCNETLVNKFSKCFRPIGDRINGAPLYWKKTVYVSCESILQRFPLKGQRK